MQRSFGRASMIRGKRPSPGRSRPPFRGGGNRGFIDPKKFINKAVINEQVEDFIPEHSFADFDIDPRLKKNISDKGYATPTPIQDKAIIPVLKDADVVGIANTGTGKTAVFLVPLINKVLLDQNQKILIIAPTRELGIQIDEEFRWFAKNLRVFSACCVGGANINRQIADLSRKHNFVIGTPGRIKDLMGRGLIDLSKFKTLVLDEADRLLDMGFINDTRYMARLLPKPHQTLFFSATFSWEVQALIAEFLNNPVMISVKKQDTAKNVDQDVIKLENGDLKVDVLSRLLKHPDFNKVLIFGRTKHGVEKLSKILSARGFRVESIHGNKSHGQRQRALGLFKESRVQVLVATDLAARGLDIDNVSHVINFDTPNTYEDYIHRIGRTGRADKKGKALTFV
ncbi:MAG: DEAD/DEAH box helicase [Minisyncoccia bacterium]